MEKANKQPQQRATFQPPDKAAPSASPAICLSAAIPDDPRLRRQTVQLLQRQIGNSGVKRLIQRAPQAAPSITQSAPQGHIQRDDDVIDQPVLRDAQAEIRGASATRGLIDTSAAILQPGARPNFHILSDSVMDARIRADDPTITSPRSVMGWNTVSTPGGGDVYLRSSLQRLSHRFHVLLIHEMLHSLMSSARGHPNDPWNEGETQFVALMIVHGGATRSNIAHAGIYTDYTPHLYDIVQAIPGLHQRHVAEEYLANSATMGDLIETALGEGGMQFLGHYLRTGRFRHTRRTDPTLYRGLTEIVNLVRGMPAVYRITDDGDFDETPPESAGGAGAGAPSSTPG